MAVMRHVRLMSLTSRISLHCFRNTEGIFLKTKRCFNAAAFQHPKCAERFGRLWMSDINAFKRGETWSICAAHIQHRHNSTNTIEKVPVDVAEEIENYIPEPPSLPSHIDVQNLPLNALGEPTLQSIGLGSNWPPGLLQQSLDYLHASVGLPWLGAIITVTLIMRIAIFPLTIMGQRNAIKMNNMAPEMAKFQDRIESARKSGNQLEFVRQHEELMLFMKQNNIAPWKNFGVLFAQMPIFITVFTGLRGMCNLPVESMKTGGLWWFTDLTVPDPYFILPVITTTTLLCTLELGSETGVQASQMSKYTKYFMRFMAVITLPIMIKFPAALALYWCTSNFFSLLMVSTLKIKSVRKILKIGDRKPTPDFMKNRMPSRGFVNTVKRGYRDAEKLQEYQTRKSLRAATFKKMKEEQ